MIQYDAEIEYLESTGTLYINTGFKPNQDTRIFTTMKCVTSNSYGRLFGAGTYNSKNSIMIDYETGATGTLCVKYGPTTAWTKVNSVKGDYNIHTYDYNKNEVYRDEVKVSENTYTAFQCTANLGIFTYINNSNNPGAATEFFKGRCYNFQIYDNDVLVRDFIPVRVGNTGYLYDKITDQLFENKGSGSFVLGPDTKLITNTGRRTSKLRRKILLLMPKHIPNYLCFTALEKGTFTITIDSALGTGTLQYIEYSIDGCKSWVRTNNVSSEQVVITTPTIKAGKKVYWRGIGSQLALNFSSNPTIISSTCKFDASGEVMSLLKGENFETSRGVGNSAFARLFLNCTTLVNTKDLIIHVGGMGSYGLLEMFKGCTNLITTPHIININSIYAFNNMFQNCTSLVEVTYPLPIPATVANRAYRAMFSGCTSLIKTPDLPLTEFGNGAYSEMFMNCSSLVEVPSVLPATSLTSSCYSSMFSGCKSLETAPKLPATSVSASGYYAMFAGCTKLINVPDIITNNVGNAAFQGMFQGCSSLTYSPIKKLPNASASALHSTFRDCTLLTEAPELPAEILNTYCYINAFRNTKISYIKMLATDVSATGCLDYWLYTVSNVSTSIFVKNINATWTNTGNSGVPTNWTVIYYDPSEDKYYTSQDKSQECDDHGNPI